MNRSCSILSKISFAVGSIGNAERVCENALLKSHQPWLYASAQRIAMTPRERV
jgi:hypothetical protein